MNPKDVKKIGDRIPVGERLLLSSALGSILASIFIYFVFENPLEAIFVGLWAPTIIGIVNFINLKFKK
jgi:hypothetical protein